MFQVSHLYGFNAIPQAGGASPTTALSFFGSATSKDSTTITAPASIIAGDLIVLLDTVAKASAPSSVTPTGFTSAFAHANFVDPVFSQINISYKIAAGTEGSSSITGMTSGGADTTGKLMYVFRGDNAITSVTPASFGFVNTGTDTITAGSGTPPLVIVAHVHGFGFDTGSNMTMGFSTTSDGEISNTHGAIKDQLFDRKIYNASPANTNITIASGSGSDFNEYGGGYFACS